jgi:hypothetical protein
MKKLILLTTALLLGSNAFAQKRNSFTQPASYPTIKLCQFASNPALYDGRMVRVVGLAYVSPSNTLVLSSDETVKGQCEGRDSMASIWARRSPGTGSLVDEFIKKLNRHGTEHNRISVEVEVVGKVTDGFSCFGPRFGIEANSIRQLSPSVPLFLE